MVTDRPRLPRPLLTAVVSVLLAVHAWFAVSATIGMGVTADETAHLTGGYSYWTFNDYRLQPENGNLPQRWGALPLLLQDPYMEPAELIAAWHTSHVWLIGQHFFFGSGNNTDYMLLTARSAMVFWSVAAGLLVFFWSRSLWGEVGGLLSLSLFAISPTTLAHGALVTSDMCATFCFIAATGAWWRVSGRIDAGTLSLSLLATAMAAVAKFSFVLLAPVFAMLLLWRLACREPLRFRGEERFRDWRSKLLPFTGLLVLHGLVAWITIWACFGFRYTPFADGLPAGWTLFASWEQILPPEGLRRLFFDVTRAHQLLPEAYLQGFAFVLAASEQRGAFLAGNYSTTGWWWFFPYAYLIKSTIGELLVSVALIASLVAGAFGPMRSRLARVLPDLVPLLVFAAVYGVASLTSNLNIGHRHILPLYPILFILAGALARPRLGRRGIIAGVILVILSAVESVAVRPHFLPFFNRIIGGPGEGWRHLVDSSLDWGQNAPRLAEWLRDHRQPNEIVYVSLFGSDDIAYHGIRAEELSPIFNFGRPRRWTELKAGLYCISATCLQDLYSPLAGQWTEDYESSYQFLLRKLRAEIAAGVRSPDMEHTMSGEQHPLWNLDRARFARLCLYLRLRQPEAVVGHSIFVFRLTEDEVRIATEGTMNELVSLMEHELRKRAQGN